MKKLLLLVSLCIGLLSCSNNGTTYNEDTFRQVRRINASSVIVYDKDTKVMYVFSYYGGFRPLYNADGTLKLYKE